jgi:peroxiredoxin
MAYIYTNENTKGKYLVLKCWFLACKACIEEMPNLNTLVKEYENRDDVIFLSLAFDKPEDLKRFLETKGFFYQTASVSQDFMEEHLKVYAYPTHLVVGKDGKFLKIVSNEKQLTRHLNSILDKKAL